jgi:hypothetical protein
VTELPEEGGTVMANTAAYNGFQQYSGNGSAPTYEQVAVQIVYNASAIYYGDPVQPDANGYVVVGTTSSGSGNTQIAGIFVGCKYLSVSQKRVVWSNYWPGSDVASTQTVEGYIVNDPNAKFVAQFGNVSVAQSYVNANVGFNIGTGNSTSGISGAFLATVGTDSSLPFRVVDLVTTPPGVNGTEAGAYQKAIVAFNNVSTKQLTGV